MVRKLLDASLTKKAASGAGALSMAYAVTSIKKRGAAMNATVEQSLITKIKMLSPQQVAEVEDFVEFLAAKSKRRAAFDRLLAIAPALEAAGVEPMTEDEIAAEVRAARAERRARQQAASQEPSKGAA